MTEYGWLAAGGALALWAQSRAQIPVAMWIGPAFLLHFSHSQPAWPGLATLTAVLYVAVVVSKRGIVPVRGPLYFMVNLPVALVAAAPFVADRLLAPRLGGFASTLVFPLAWVSAEHLAARFGPYATWGSCAYTQHDQLPLIQIVSVTGISGVSFLVAWFASTLEWTWSQSFSAHSIQGGVLIYAAVLGVVLTWGAVRIARTPTDGKHVLGGVVSFPPGFFERGEVTRFVQARIRPEEREAIAAKVARLQDWFLEQTLDLARAGVRLVMWPEINLLVFKEDEARFYDWARALASAERIHLLMGLAIVQTGAKHPLENRATLLGPKGETLFTYLKSKRTIGWEEKLASPGDGRLPVVETEHGRVGSAICYDADWPYLIRQLGQGFSDLFVLPANDWREIKEVHHHMAVFRAIENGMPMLRANSTGWSAAVDRVGRVVAMTDHFAPDARTLIARVPLGGVRTLYARYGDVFAWLCVAVLLAAIGTVAFHGPLTAHV